MKLQKSGLLSDWACDGSFCVPPFLSVDVTVSRLMVSHLSVKIFFFFFNRILRSLKDEKQLRLDLEKKFYDLQAELETTKNDRRALLQKEKKEDTRLAQLNEDLRQAQEEKLHLIDERYVFFIAQYAALVGS